MGPFRHNLMHFHILYFFLQHYVNIPNMGRYSRSKFYPSASFYQHNWDVIEMCALALLPLIGVLTQWQELVIMEGSPYRQGHSVCVATWYKIRTHWPAGIEGSPSGPQSLLTSSKILPPVDFLRQLSEQHFSPCRECLQVGPPTYDSYHITQFSNEATNSCSWPLDVQEDNVSATDYSSVADLLPQMDRRFWHLHLGHLCLWVWLPWMTPNQRTAYQQARKYSWMQELLVHRSFMLCFYERNSHYYYY